MAFSHELLKTFAAVPVASRILIREDQPTGHAIALLQLGFAIHVRVPAADRASVERRLIAHQTPASTWSVETIGAPLPRASFDWAVWALPDTLADPAGADELKRIRSALCPGGWCYVLSPEGSVPSGNESAASEAPYTPRRLTAWADTARLAEASAPWHVAAEEALHAMYRRVESDTPV
ncbi:MAG: hypothetical protein GVY15_06195 [Bacteroidetes bacterium]|nr:hypothetical protein [Bacteroidota bacterium]